MIEERVSIKIRLKYDDSKIFQQRFAPFMSRYGMFLPMQQPKNRGTLLVFEIYLSNNKKIFCGEGDVVAVYAPPEHNISGIGIRFSALEKNSHIILNKILQQRYPLSPLVPQLTPGTVAVMGEEPNLPPSNRSHSSSPITDTDPSGVEQTPQMSHLTQDEQLSTVLPLFYGTEDDIPATGPIIGIDLGTTNSCCAIVDNNRPGVIPSRYGYNTIPSVVAYDERHNLLIGHPAKSQMLLNPHNTVYGSKRLVGRKYHSPIVQIIKDRFHYNIIESENGDAGVKINSHPMTLQEVSALILHEIREIAQNHLQQPVYRAVISVPAYYNDNQRQAVRKAGLLAGLRVERIVNEPTAAALAYGFGRSLEQKLLVYDLGGGTFDASILHIHREIYEVLSTGGNTFLGGVDFDNRLMDYVVEFFVRQHEVEIYNDSVNMQRIKDAVEKAKCDLSTEESTELHVPYIAIKDGKPIDLQLTITRQQLVALVEDLVDETLRVCDEVLQVQNFTPNDIDEIILVGGQTRMPLIHQRLTEHFGKPPHRNVHPDEAVAVGTALLASSFGRADQLRLIDVLAMSIGVGLPGGRFKPIIPRNNKLPFQKNYTIGTTRDNQTELDIVIFQGESDHVSENEYIGTLSLRNIRKQPRGKSKFDIRFQLNHEGILTVTARDLETQQIQEVIFNTRETPQDIKKKLNITREPPPKPAVLPLIARGRIQTAALKKPPPKIKLFAWLKKLLRRFKRSAKK